MKNLATAAFASLLSLVLTACGQAEPAKAPKNDIRVVITTSKGDIEATIFASKTPITAANFLNLAKRGYYNDVKFHRVIPEFMIQGGDPTETGSGDPGYKFQDETRKDLLHNKAGILSMANSDRGKQPFSNAGTTNGSQFFITHLATPHLDGMHTVFGEVSKGQNVVDSINGKLSGPGWKTDGKGDKIISIKILDSTDELFKLHADQLTEWNKILDQKYPIKK